MKQQITVFLLGLLLLPILSGALLGQSAPSLDAPVIISPIDGFYLTDVASYFEWWMVDNIETYHLELSRDETFTDPIRIFKELGDTVKYTHPGQYQRLLDRYPNQIRYFPREVLATGTWYWRVRAVTEDSAGMWSDVYVFYVNDDHAMNPPTRPISPGEPLLIIEAWRATELTGFADSIPMDLQPYVALNANYGGDNILRDLDYMQFLAPAIENKMLYVETTMGPTPAENWTSLANVEWAFQHHPNIVGVKLGEVFWAFDWPGQWWQHEYYQRLVTLAAKYGKYVFWGDGNHARGFPWQRFAGNPDWAEFNRKYAQYLVFMPKTNVDWKQYTSHGATLGMWLSGMSAHFGIWHEHWYWGHAGFWELGKIEIHDSIDYEAMTNIHLMPPTFWNQIFLQGLAQGASVYILCGQSTLREYHPDNPPQHYAGVWDRAGRTTSLFHRHIVPFFRGLIYNRMIPTQQDVLDNIRVAVSQEMVRGRETVPVEPRQDYRYYDALYRGTYGMREDGEYYELIPNTGQYYYIPLLPYDVASLGNDIATIPLSELQHEDSVRSLFDSYYERQYRGDAFVSTVGNTIVIMTTHENRDIDEWYEIPLNQGNIFSISGAIGPHKYIMAKIQDSGHSLWLQANTSYPERDTIIQFACKTEPSFHVTPAAALLDASWDGETGVFSLALSHQAGAVDVLLQTQPYSEQYYSDEILPRQFGLLTPKDKETELDPDAVTLSWEAASFASQYEVFVALDPDFSQLVATHKLQETEVSVPDLAYGQTYYWKVRAISLFELETVPWARWNENGASRFTTAVAESKPMSLVLLQASDWFGQVELHWEPVRYADGYSIYRRASEKGDFDRIVAALPRSATSYQDMDLETGRFYEYVVVPFNSFGEGRGVIAEVYVRSTRTLVDQTLNEDLHEGLTRQGAWSLGETANLRAIIPRAFGSWRLTEFGDEHYVLTTRMRINELGSHQFAVIRLSLNQQGRDRDQLLYHFRDHHWELQRRTGDATTHLASAQFPLELDTWHVLSVAQKDGILRFLVDGKEVFEAKDGSPLAPGDIEFYVTNMSVDFDYLSLDTCLETRTKL